ncbi:Uncharacterized protein dnm_086400 [Desulfonema magnum]|uniref:Uncharacterized protein n=1 Tax=Desulfonema magnum TaxID=45655 RepID=A0A975BWA7_9BACT|nr:Uncharacterized protein dnm_086400 [Desulfonema magnum]
MPDEKNILEIRKIKIRSLEPDVILIYVSCYLMGLFKEVGHGYNFVIKLFRISETKK